jgi:hypothetical protein
VKSPLEYPRPEAEPCVGTTVTDEEYEGEQA